MRLQSRGSAGRASWAVWLQGVHRCQNWSGIIAGDRATGQDGRGLNAPPGIQRPSPHGRQAYQEARPLFLPEAGPVPPSPGGKPHWPWWRRSRKLLQHEHRFYAFFHGENFGSGATHPLCFSFSPHTPKHNSHRQRQEARKEIRQKEKVTGRNRKSKNYEPSQSGSPSGASHEAVPNGLQLNLLSHLSSTALASAHCSYRQGGPQTPGTPWDRPGGPGACREQADSCLQSLERHRHPSMPFTFQIPDVSSIITQLINHSPRGCAERNMGEESAFCTDQVLTQCILEGRRGGLNAPTQGQLGNCRFS